MSFLFTIENLGLIIALFLSFRYDSFKLLGLIIIFYCLFLSPLSSFLLQIHERKHKVLNILPENSELILVLGSGGTPEAELPVSQRLGTAALQRCLEGIRLWKLDPRKTLVFSSRGREGYPSQASLYADFAVEQGVDPLKIRLLELGYNTESEARDFKCVFPEEDSLILVTSAIHILRATTIFLNYGLEIFPAPSDFTIKIHPAGNRLNFLPSVSAIQHWNILIHEWVGLLWVKVRVMLGFFLLNCH